MNDNLVSSEEPHHLRDGPLRSNGKRAAASGLSVPEVDRREARQWWQFSQASGGKIMCFWLGANLQETPFTPRPYRVIGRSIGLFFLAKRFQDWPPNAVGFLGSPTLNAGSVELSSRRKNLPLILRRF